VDLFACFFFDGTWQVPSLRKLLCAFCRPYPVVKESNVQLSPQENVAHPGPCDSWGKDRGDWEALERAGRQWGVGRGRGRWARVEGRMNVWQFGDIPLGILELFDLNSRGTWSVRQGEFFFKTRRGLAPSSPLSPFVPPTFFCFPPRLRTVF